MLLSGIKSPDDLKKIPEEKLPELSDEIRKKIIETVAKNGGHLASNLGVVELTIAIHRVFSSPKDAVIFDVSHQAYTHKLLTGRYNSFSSIRKHDGISGFTRRMESEHDFFDNGHSSTSISQGLGLLTAWNYCKKDGKVIAVIGDGALTGGLAFEAMNHAGQLAKNLIVVLNDNQMSISPNTGSVSRYLSSLTMTGFYQKFRNFVDRLVDKIPYSEHHLGKMIFRLKRGIKGVFLNTNLFTDFGFEYVGPLDGHNIKLLEDTFNRVKSLSKPVVVHVLTKKGKGYSPAENDPSTFHGVGPFQISNGVMEKFDTLSFTENFSQTIIEAASKNEKVAAITAAMSKGTGLDAFSRRFQNRFFDVGIAEEHAVTFAAGLSAGGMIPVVAIYSTFIQRAVDQIIHDVALPDFHVVFCFDRAGVVPGDGSTHQGLFDISILRPIPNIIMLSPCSASDQKKCLEFALEKTNHPVIIRYPKLSCPSELKAFEGEIEDGRGLLVKCEDFAPALSTDFETEPFEIASGKCDDFKKVLFVTTGGMFAEVLQAARLVLQSHVYADIYSLRFLKPLDEEYFTSLAQNYDGVVFVEDGVQIGGIGEYLEDLLHKKNQDIKTFVKAFPDRFLHHGNREQICEDARMSPKHLSVAALSLF